MKITHLILGSLVAATSWAKFEGTYAFFVNVGGKLKPLEVLEQFPFLSSLVWGDSTYVTEFTYTDGIAISATSGLRGSIVLGIGNGIRLSETASGTKLILEEKTNKILNAFYYSCEADQVYYGSKVSIIEGQKINEKCFLVDVHFMEYDKETKGPSENSYVPVFYEFFTRVFYVTGKDDLEPITIETSEEFLFSNKRTLYHGKSNVTPLEVITQHDYAFTEIGNQYSGYLVFSENRFEIDRTSMASLGLTENWKVSARRLFSCETDESEHRRIVLNPSKCSDWKEVDIYLLQNDRETGKPKEGEFRPSKDESIPHAFFFKEKGIWRIVSFKIDGNGRPLYAMASPIGVDKHFEFSLKNNIACTQNTRYPEFVGFNDIDLTFGENIQQTPFEFDNEMKITNHHFYLSPDRRVFVDVDSYVPLPEIDMYLLPLNRANAKPFGRSDMPEEDDWSRSASWQSNPTTTTHSPEEVDWQRSAWQYWSIPTTTTHSP